MDATLEKNRREFPRFSTNLPLTVSTVESPFSIFRAVCGNISKGGAFLRSSGYIKPGKQVAVEFRLDNDGCCAHSIARVAWANRPWHLPEGEIDLGVAWSHSENENENMERVWDYLTLLEAWHTPVR